MLMNLALRAYRMYRWNVLGVAMGAILAAVGTTVSAKVQMNGLFTNHMVLQRGMADPVWGTAAPGESVTVAMAGQRVKAVADAKGEWMVKLAPMQATSVGQTLVVRGSESRVVLHDVLVGEVWLCAGQSNMEFTMMFQHNAMVKINRAKYPNLRLFQVSRIGANHPASTVSADPGKIDPFVETNQTPEAQISGGGWRACTPTSVRHFSAVAYYFGRNLQERLHVPVGLIEADWGGTQIETWISHGALARDTDGPLFFRRWKQALADYPALLATFNQELKRYRKIAKTDRAEHKKLPRHPLFPCWSGKTPATSPIIIDQRVYHYGVAHPAGLFNGMIAPLIPMAIGGVVWYQGESNFERGLQYHRLLPLLIHDWRRHWRDPKLPFLIVQLPNIAHAKKGLFPGSPRHPFMQNWFASVREAQMQASQTVSHTATVVTCDNKANDVDIHPENKPVVGYRLALAAEATVYHQRVVWSGPLYKSMRVRGHKIVVRFTHVDGGLTTRNGKPLNGFAIAGKNGDFVWAEAKIVGRTIVVESSKVPDPVAVRYDWDVFPGANLCNTAKLPASPFRSDTFPVLGDKNR